ncbi:hypothetical protein BCR43DRAFT_498793 [Syncephalastrum racemosum]|uniref:Uncharacterized protein n=1 Tax=Syncephalastrum racemosum TaxID=13706 RepID=A0A1X2H1H5_SYNRA|nr:hypothetical protein BCR43DRAFT_498793 [Syncephalastrum racemosum]
MLSVAFAETIRSNMTATAASCAAEDSCPVQLKDENEFPSLQQANAVDEGWHFVQDDKAEEDSEHGEQEVMITQEDVEGEQDWQSVVLKSSENEEYKKNYADIVAAASAGTTDPSVIMTHNTGPPFKAMSSSPATAQHRLRSVSADDDDQLLGDELRAQYKSSSWRRRRTPFAMDRRVNLRRTAASNDTTDPYHQYPSHAAVAASATAGGYSKSHSKPIVCKPPRRRYRSSTTALMDGDRWMPIGKWAKALP